MFEDSERRIGQSIVDSGRALLFLTRGQWWDAGDFASMYWEWIHVTLMNGLIHCVDIIRLQTAQDTIFRE